MTQRNNKILWMNQSFWNDVMRVFFFNFQFFNWNEWDFEDLRKNYLCKLKYSSINWIRLTKLAFPEYKRVWLSYGNSSFWHKILEQTNQNISRNFSKILIFQVIIKNQSRNINLKKFLEFEQVFFSASTSRDKLCRFI